MSQAARKWTPEEDAILARLFPAGTSVRDLALRLGRTVMAVASRANSLHLRRSCKQERLRWTPELTRYLRRSWGNIPLASLSRELGISAPTIRKRAELIGLDGTIYGQQRKATLNEFVEPEPGRKPTPTDARPGSADKIQVLTERFARGEELFHTRDRRIDLK